MKKAEAMTAHEMAQMLEAPVEPPVGALPTATATESPRFTARAGKAPADDSKKNRAA